RRHLHPHPFPTRRSSDLPDTARGGCKARKTTPPGKRAKRAKPRAKDGWWSTLIRLAVCDATRYTIGALCCGLDLPLLRQLCAAEDRKSTRLNSSHVAISY